MKHAEVLIERILFLDATPNMTELMKLTVGQNVQDQIESDLKLEISAVAMYNRAIQICRDEGDNTSRELFERLLKDEEDHVDWLEAQLHQIRELGYERYLSHRFAKRNDSWGACTPADCKACSEINGLFHPECGIRCETWAVDIAGHLSSRGIARLATRNVDACHPPTSSKTIAQKRSTLRCAFENQRANLPFFAVARGTECQHVRAGRQAGQINIDGDRDGSVVRDDCRRLLAPESF